MEAIFAATSEVCKATIVAFNSRLPTGRKTGFVEKGVATKGGIQNAEDHFSALIVQLFATPPLDLRDVATIAIKLSQQIVEIHHFNDANGRTCMFALYFILANWGFKLPIKPVFLHAYLMTETQVAYPPMATEVVLAFAQSAPRSALRNHLGRIEKQLISLEIDRLVMKDRVKQYATNHGNGKRKGPKTQPPLPSKRLPDFTEIQQVWKDRSVVDARAIAMNRRGAEEEFKKLLLSHQTPCTDSIVNMWMTIMTDDLGSPPTAAEVTVWMKHNWVD